VLEARFTSNKFTASALSFHVTLFSLRYSGRLMALLVASVLLQARRTVSNILREKKNGISGWSAVLSWIMKNPHHRCHPPIRPRLPSHFQKPDGEIPSYSAGS
jgi:hypothetical protein